MKKRILIMMILLLTTGCTCEYNLTIDGNTYKEEVNIIGETSQEISEFNNEWNIPIDKEEYDMILGLDGEYDTDSDIYNYKKLNNELTFNYDFSRSKFINSTAVSNCYDKLTVSNYNNTTIISSSSKVNCFDKYPTLTNIKVTIKVDRNVISNNADSVSGNTYTWNLTNSNKDDKSINLVLENVLEEEENNPSTNNNQTSEKKNDYTLYIFLIILVIIIFLGYKWFMKFKDKNNNID